MASKIEWLNGGDTWNPIITRVRPDAAAIARDKGYTSLVQIATEQAGKRGHHCEHIAPGCQNCYAESMNGRCFPSWGTGLPYDRRSRDLLTFELHEETLLQPLRWKKPRSIFPCSMTDLFGEWVPDEFIDRMFAVMALCPQHRFICLSKRSKRMSLYVSEKGRRFLVDGAIRRIGNRHGGPHMEAAEEGRVPLSGVRPSSSLQSRSCGVSSGAGLPTDRHNHIWSQDNNDGSQGGVGALQWGNTDRLDNQPQEWSTGRQSASQSGISNHVGTAPALDICSQLKTLETSRCFAPEDQTYRRERERDESTSRGGGTSSVHSQQVFDEPASRFSDLPEAYMEAPGITFPLPNVILGTSASDDITYHLAAPYLRELAAAGWKTLLSAEPLLGDIAMGPNLQFLSWCITGSESGHGARPMNEDWVRSIRDQCVTAGVPFFYKQKTVAGKKIGTPELDGRYWIEMPEVLR